MFFKCVAIGKKQIPIYPNEIELFCGEWSCFSLYASNKKKSFILYFKPQEWNLYSTFWILSILLQNTNYIIC